MKIGVNNQNIIQMFEKQITQNRLSHAYLFSGNSSTPKLLTALYVSCLLYCKHDTKPCFECSECKSIQDLEHINITYIKKEGSSVKKEQILKLQDELAKTSLVKGKRIYIIDDANSMTLSAANSLLKFIEEPANKESIAILLTESITSIIPTILSRCFVINFKEINHNDFIDLLIKENMEEDIVNIISHLTNDLSIAKEYSIDQNILMLGSLLQDFLSATSKAKLVLFFQKHKKYFDDNLNVKLFVKMLAILFSDLIKLNYGVDYDLKSNSELYVKYLNTIGYERIKNNLELTLDANSKFDVHMSTKNLLQNLFINFFS